LVVGVRTLQDGRSLTNDDLSPDDRTPLTVLVERELIAPFRRRVLFPYRHGRCDVRVTACREAADGRDASPLPCDSGLEPATDRRNVSQESEGIDQIGLARCVWPDDKRSSLQVDIDGTEVPPVLEPQVCDSKGFGHLVEPPEAIAALSSLTLADEVGGRCLD
jgi:hypothetical protein